MDSLDHFDETFEPALVEEMNKLGQLKYFNEGDVIMDYGNYIHMVSIVVKGTINVF